MIFASGRSDRRQKVAQVRVQISAVRQSALRLEIGADLDVLVFDLESLGESGQRSSGTRQVGSYFFASIQTQERDTQDRYEKSGQRSFFRCLDSDAGESPSLGLAFDSVQQHRFPNTPQSVKNQAAGSPSGPYPVERYGRALDKLVSSGKLRGRRTGARCVGILARIHL